MIYLPFSWFWCIEVKHHRWSLSTAPLFSIDMWRKNWEGSELDFRQCQTTILRLSCIKLSSCNHWHVECLLLHTRVDSFYEENCHLKFWTLNFFFITIFMKKHASHEMKMSGGKFINWIQNTNNFGANSLRKKAPTLPNYIHSSLCLLQ